MSNPFNKSLDGFRGKQARVMAGGTVYEGWVERIHHAQRHVVLRDGVRLDQGRTRVGRVMVAHAETIEEVEPEGKIRDVPLEDVAPSPYHQREFDPAENADYIEQVHNNGWAGSYPVVRPVEGGYQVVEGHKRLWVAQQAAFGSHPARVIDMDDREAATRFVMDHLPTEEEEVESERPSGRYDDVDTKAAIYRLIERHGQWAMSLHRVAWNADRLELDVEEIETEEPSKGHECEVCEQTFDSKRGKEIHKSKMHSDEQIAAAEEVQTLQDEAESEAEEEEEAPDKGTIAPEVVHLDDYGDWLTGLDVRNALTEAESPETFAGVLGMDEDAAAELLRDLGVYEMLDNGTDTIDEDEASTIVHNAVAGTPST